MNDIFGNEVLEIAANMKKSSYRGIVKSGVTNYKDDILTPMWLVDIMINWGIFNQWNVGKVLDPCCGDGRMIARLYERDYWPQYVVECDIKDGNDFFNYNFVATQFDLILMNPPFSNLGVYRFIKSCFDRQLLKEHGKIIAIVPTYILDNAEGRKKWLCERLNHMAILPKNTFAPEVPVLNAFLCEFVHPKMKTSRDFYIFNEKNDQYDLGE